MHRKTYRIALLLACSFAGQLLSAQGKNTTHGNQQWLQYYNQTRLSDKWSLLADGGYRWKDGFARRTQYIGRVAVGYHLSAMVDLGMGFAHLGFYTDEGIGRLEYRPHQEFILKQVAGRTSFAHRFRIEERYFSTPAHNGTSAGKSFNLRLRYRFSWNIPLFPLAAAHPDRKLALNLADEILLNAGKQVVYNVFDQNRILLGLALPLYDQLTFSLTYSGQYAASNTPAGYTATDVLWMGIVHKADLRRKTHTNLP